MTNYLNAKNGIEILHKDGQTQLLAGAGSPAVIGQEASIGSIFLRCDNGGGIYSKVASPDTGWVLTASGTSPSPTISGGLTPEQHIALHNGNKFIEYTREANKVVRTDEWLDETKTHYISSTSLERVAGKVSSFTQDLYDFETGTFIIATISGTINRASGKVISIKYSRDNIIGGY